MLIGSALLVVGIALVLWGAERFTDGAVKTSTRFGLSTFYVGAVASGFEPENLATGIAAAAGNLPQIALGTVIGSAIFMLTGGLGAALILVAPARRGHPELAWGNVVGTTIVLLTLNLGVVALVRPITADPVVLSLHAPYLIGCTVLVASTLLWARALGRVMGTSLVILFVSYLALNISHMWR